MSYFTKTIARLISLVLAAQWAAVALAANVSPVQISLGQVVSNTQDAVTRSIFEFSAQSGRPYIIDLAQEGLDFIIDIKIPDVRLSTYNAPIFREGPEFLSLRTDADEIVRIEVYSAEYTAVAGKFTLVVREADAIDRRLQEAFSAVSLASSLNHKGGLESWTAAAKLYESAANILDGTLDPGLRAYALFCAASIRYWSLYEWQDAERLAEYAGALFLEIGETAAYQNTQHLRAAAIIEYANEQGVESANSRFREALTILNQAADAYDSLNRRYEYGRVINNIGLTYFYRGENQPARKYWLEAAQLFEVLKESTAEQISLSNIAVIDMEEGYFDRAISPLNRVVEVTEKSPDLVLRARTLDNLGVAYRYAGHFDAALDAHIDALALHDQVNPMSRAYSLLGLGQVYFARGHWDLAYDFLSDSIPDFERVNDGRLMSTAYRYLGDISFVRGDYAAARELHERALVHAPSLIDQFTNKLALARDASKFGEAASSLSLATNVLREAEALGADLLVAGAHLEMGRAHLVLNKPQLAQDELSRAKEVFERLRIVENLAETYSLEARAAVQMGDLESALNLNRRAVEIVENSRRQLISPEHRAIYSASQREYYEAYIATLMALHQSQGEGDNYLYAALTVSERYRGRMFSEFREEADAGVLEDLEPEDAKSLVALEQELSALRYRRDKALGAESPEPGQLQFLSQRLSETESQIDLWNAATRQKYSSSSRYFKAEHLEAQEIQAQLDDHTSLLHYSVGANASFVWLLTNEGIQSETLPGRDVLTSLVRDSIDGLMTVGQREPGGTDADYDIASVVQLLLSPTSVAIGRTRLLIAPDGPLAYLPFSAIPLGSGSSDRLLSRFEISNITSFPRNLHKDESALAGSFARVLAVADPIFSDNDPRLKSRPVPPAYADSRSEEFAPRGLRDLVRLPYTRKEADSIARIVGSDNLTLLEGVDATAEALLNANIVDYEYIHLATHGLVDSRYPYLSAMALSIVDGSNNRQSGLLSLTDIFSLDLDARLVVLSACETALGREIRGEGLMGLAQAFSYAGADRTVASLWRVPDRATSELMARFYGFLLEEKRSVAGALRAAQLSMSRERRWGAPYFWAGHVVMDF